jgi:hypothetical protein
MSKTRELFAMIAKVECIQERCRRSERQDGGRSNDEDRKE